MSNKEPRNKRRRFRVVKLVVLLVVLLLLAAAVYFWMPQFSPRTIGFWLILTIILAVCTMVIAAAYGKKMEEMKSDNHDDKSVSDLYSVAITTFAVLTGVALAIMVIGGIAGMKCFHATMYSNIIGQVQPVDMEDYQISLDDVPLLDRDSAYLLANRKMGTLVDLVSQFTLNKDVNVQINYQGKPVRVIPLKYNGVVKWFNNRGEGIPGYVIVDMQTLSAELVYVDGGIHFAPSACFNEDLMRHVYLRHPTDILDGYSFELMDDGTPVWLVRKWTPTVALFGGRDLAGIYVVNAVNGDIDYYDVRDIPRWVDTAYPADTIITQYDWHGTLQGGWWNSIISKRGVVKTTEGYNYIAYNDDIYLYTGITSVASDESNIGFIFTNLRTKETTQYTYSSAEEYSAMASAEGLVQHLGYSATFPIMVRVCGVPTYCMALKDNAGLVKQYSMVNAEQYYIVVAANSIDQTIEAYVQALDENDIAHDYYAPTEPDDGEVEPGPGDVEAREQKVLWGNVTSIDSAVIDGNTYYYISLDVQGYEDEIFEVPAYLNKEIITTRVGDNVEIYCNVDDIHNIRMIPVNKFSWFSHEPKEE